MIGLTNFNIYERREDGRWEMKLRGDDRWGCPWTYKGKTTAVRCCVHWTDCSLILISEDTVFEAHSLKIY